MPDPTAPTMIRACGIDLANGRLTQVRIESPGRTSINVHGDHTCPVHGDGACLVTYRAEQVRRA